MGQHTNKEAVQAGISSYTAEAMVDYQQSGYWLKDFTDDYYAKKIDDPKLYDQLADETEFANFAVAYVTGDFFVRDEADPAVKTWVSIGDGATQAAISAYLEKVMREHQQAGRSLKGFLNAYYAKTIADPLLYDHLEDGADFMNFAVAYVTGDFLILDNFDRPVRAWYMDKFPTDELGAELDDKATFLDVLTALDSHPNTVYEVLGAVTDTTIRERVFQELAAIMKVDYDHIYNRWMQR